MAISRVIYCALDRVKTSGVVAQDRRFVFGLEVVAFEDLVDFLHAIPEGNLVRKVGSEHEWFGTDPLDRISQRLFIALAADENLATGEILFRFVFKAKPAVFHFSLQTIDHNRDPSRAAFEKTDAQLGKLVEHAF